MQETDTPGELLVTRGGSLRPTSPVEAPAAAQGGEQDPPGPTRCSQAPGTESGKQIPKEASEISPLRGQNNSGGAKAEEKQQPVAEPALGPSGAGKDKADDDAGAPGLQQDTGPGAGNHKPGKDCTAIGGLGRAEAGRRTPLGAEAGSVVLGE